MKKWLACLVVLGMIGAGLAPFMESAFFALGEEWLSTSVADTGFDTVAAGMPSEIDPLADGYERIAVKWNPAEGRGEAHPSLMTDAIDCLAIGQKCRMVVQSGYDVNIVEYDDQDNELGYAFDELQTGDIDFVVTRNRFRIILVDEADEEVLPELADMAVRLYRETADRQYGAGKYYGKRISILGDSLSSYGGSLIKPNSGTLSEEGNKYNYPGNKCRYPNTNLQVVDPHQTYWMRVIDYFHMELDINDSIAGSMVSWDGKAESISRGADKHMASQTRIDHLGLNGAPDIILIYGGTNDMAHCHDIGEVDYSDIRSIDDYAALPVSDFSSAYRTMLLRIMHTYPDARIICILPNISKNSLQKTNAFDARIIEICNMLGVPYIDARQSGITFENMSSYMPDGVHYNLQGSERLADLIITKLINDVSIR